MTLHSLLLLLWFAQSSGGTITGVVIDSSSGQPIPDAQISATKLRPAPTAPAGGGTTIITQRTTVQVRPVMTDINGRFAITNLELGNYQIRATAERYSGEASNTGSTVANKSVVLFDKEPAQTVTFRLLRGAVVGGHVFGPAGEPLSGMEVSLFVPNRTPDGQITYQQSSYALTNDRGEYRLFPVNPGRYYLSAGPPVHRVPGVAGVSPLGNPKNKYVPMFYPAGSEPGTSAPLDVAAGAEMNGLDFRLNDQPVFHVRGRVTDPVTGQLGRNIGISIQPAASKLTTGVYSSANIVDFRDGSFELANVAPGRYIIRAQTALAGRIGVVITSTSPSPTSPPPAPASAGSAAALVEVLNGDVNGVALVLGPPFSLSGRAVMDNGAPVPPGARLNLSLRTGLPPGITGGSPVFQWNDDGSFRIDRVEPGEYTAFIGASGSTGSLFVKEARFGQTDVLTQPFVVTDNRSDQIVVTLSQNGAQIIGTVVGKTSSTTRVVLAPNDRTRGDLYKSATAPNGRFSLQGIPSGNYKLFAFTDIDTRRIFDAAFLSGFENGGTPVVLVPGTTVSINVNSIQP